MKDKLDTFLHYLHNSFAVLGVAGKAATFLALGYLLYQTATTIGYANRTMSAISELSTLRSVQKQIETLRNK